MAASLFEVVAEPQRRRILDALRAATTRSASWSTCSAGTAHRVQAPEGAPAGGAGRRPTGRTASWCRLRPEPLRELDRWLEPYRRAWAGRLDAGDHLDRMEEDDD